MIEHTDTTLSKDILNPILETGPEGLSEAVSLLINHAMLVERSRHLGVAPYQRNSLCNGHSNGFKSRCFENRLEAIELKVPQVRNSDIPFYPHALERGQRSEKIRVAGIVRSCAVFTAIAIRSHDGKRTVLGTSISLSEAEVHWRDFLSNLKSRGLFPTGVITSDAHESLKAALASVFSEIPWNRCQFYLQQNAQSYVSKQEMKSSIAADICSIFNSESLDLATQKLAAMVEKYSAVAPKLAAWMEENLQEGFTVFAFPEPIRQRLRTSNLCEALNKQIRRRTRVASIFPNKASCLRLVSAILMELSDEWESSNAYLKPEFLR